MKFSMEPADKSKNIYIFALIAFSFLFSLCVRLTWVYQMNGADSMRWNNEFMVTTNDAYYWAEGARDLIFCDKDNASMGEYYQKNCHQENDLSPVDESLPQLTHALYHILPFSLETLIFYMSAFGASLVVIPMILLGRRLHLLMAGFIASLIASLGISYYSRTVIGYYDTDMFNIMFPMFLVWSISLALKTREKKYLLLTGLEIVLYRWWYPASYSLEFAFFGLVLVYVLIYERKSVFHYQLLSIMLIGMMGLPFLERFVGVLLLYFIAFRKEFEKFGPHILIGSAIVFFFAGGINPIIGQLNGYIFQRDGTVEAGALHFFSVTQTIVEAQNIDIADIASRTSGNIFLFIVGIIGYGWLCFRQPVMLIMLPLLGLGVVISLWGGLRFAMYAIPITAFGTGFFIYRIAEMIHEYAKNKKIAAIASVIFVCVAATFALKPLVESAWNYRTGTVFVKDEVALIEEFGKNVSREDYVITWWDYGYPIRYYADTKTLIDGGKHSGDVNFPTSFILSHDQKSAANLARLDVEYTEHRALIEKENDNIAHNLSTRISKYAFDILGFQYDYDDDVDLPSNNIAWMMQDYGFSNSNDLILSLRTDMELPQKTRDIYFYLPYRMLDIYSTIMKFSYLDLMSGKDARMPFLLISRNFQDSGATLQLDQGFSVNKQQSLLVFPNQQTYPIKKLVRASYQEDGKLHLDTQNLRYDGIYTLIHLPTYNTFLVVDDAMYNSVYIKLFYLEDYDHDLFELVSSNPYGKFFKLKM
jgi:dolichyl-diphosphooligosaccharide--protein glycosyltransferase/undecaprenyl-diphosphooligosaccharide--protein glycosyltransferase